jgi:hypothetical protein
MLALLNVEEPSTMSRTAREWAKDRALLEELLDRQRGEEPA